MRIAVVCIGGKTTAAKKNPTMYTDVDDLYEKMGNLLGITSSRLKKAWRMERAIWEESWEPMLQLAVAAEEKKGKIVLVHGHDTSADALVVPTGDEYLRRVEALMTDAGITTERARSVGTRAAAAAVQLRAQLCAEGVPIFHSVEAATRWLEFRRPE